MFKFVIFILNKFIFNFKNGNSSNKSVYFGQALFLTLQFWLTYLNLIKIGTCAWIWSFFKA